MPGQPLRLLLTNDDGVDAPGLEALRIASEPFGEAVVVAPSGHYSGCGHAVTTGRPISVTSLDDRRFAIGGTPADCVRVALRKYRETPDWVVSGINSGGNLGTDVHHSGTAAAAREAAMHGIPAIAISHYIARGRRIDWDLAGRFAAEVLRLLFARTHYPGTFWNVNLPHLESGSPFPRIVDCPVDPSPLPLEFRFEGDQAVYTGDYQKRERRPGQDVEVCFGGSIAISLVRIAIPSEPFSGVAP